MPLGNPAEHEERAPAPCSANTSRTRFVLSSTAGNARPLVAADVRFERRDLEVVLDVDRQRVDDPARTVGVGWSCMVCGESGEARADQNVLRTEARATSRCPVFVLLRRRCTAVSALSVSSRPRSR